MANNPSIASEIRFEISKWDTMAATYFDNMWVRFYLGNYWILTLVIDTIIKSHYFKLPVKISEPGINYLLKYLSLKIWSEPIYSDFQDGCTFFLLGIAQRILSQSHFQARLWRIFENMMSLHGDSPKNRGFPTISCTISCRNMSYDTLIWSYDTCFVEYFI